MFQLRHAGDQMWQQYGNVAQSHDLIRSI